MYASISDSLDAWYREMPFQPPPNHLLPHILLLHLLYHQTCVIVHRQFYRSHHSASATKCDTAAESILDILQVSANTNLAHDAAI